MARAATFYLSKAKAPESSIRMEFRYTTNHLSFADCRKFGKKEHTITLTIGPWKVKPADFSGQRVGKKNPNHRILNETMDTLGKRAIDLHAQFVEEGRFPAPADYKDLIKIPENEAQTDRAIESDFDLWIEHLQNKKVSEKFAADCALTKTRFCAFLKGRKLPLSYASISTPILGAFEKYLFSQPAIKKTNTVNKYIERLKQFLTFANKEGWSANEVHKYYSLHEETNPFPTTLTEAEIQSLLSLDMRGIYNYRRSGAAEITRDLFVFATQTGARFANWTSFDVVPVTQGYNIRFTQAKTLHPVEIPLTNIAIQILQKYNFALPSPLSPTNTLKYIQEMCDHLGFAKKVTTHTARRTCATTLEAAGVPRQFIMRLTGHKTEKSYLRYIGITFSTNADLIRSYVPERFSNAL